MAIKKAGLHGGSTNRVGNLAFMAGSRPTLSILPEVAHVACNGMLGSSPMMHYEHSPKIDQRELGVGGPIRR